MGRGWQPGGAGRCGHCPPVLRASWARWGRGCRAGASERCGGALAPYTTYDHLPPLHARDRGLPLAYPYGDITPGRSVTPGGGRLTVEEDAGHHRITLDHLGCDAQTIEAKHEAFKQLALAAEAHCATGPGNPYRGFEFPRGTIEPRVFVRALLAVELGDHTPLDRLTAAATAAAGPVRPAQAQG
ncbi:DUF6420 family protein [Kitasatospora sp. NPDC085879]|uniref:DUF6420 family protein n=1 Tax=Kitasatospora sp. NPDC085879 TaxID=3154769 RepID=UPI003443F9FF